MSAARRVLAAALTALTAPLALALPLAAQAPVAPSPAAQAPAADSLRLDAAQAAARAADPRARESALLARQSALRLRSLAADRLPTVATSAQAQYQSDVTHFGAQLPPTLHVPSLPRDTYDGHLELRQPIVDPTVAPREALERASLAESQAQLGATLFTLRQEVNDAFFAAASLQARSAEVSAAMSALAASLAVARERVRGGAALPSDTAILAATLLQRRQDSLQLAADRHAALARLGDLMGRPVSDTEPLALPHLAAAAAEARRSLGDIRARPEYARFEAARARIATEERVATARNRPRLFAFGRAGYGRPGLDMLNPNFQGYWLGGVQVQWTPWNWGTTSRDREALELQREIVATDDSAFTRQLRRAVEGDLATMARLDSTIADDDRIIALRELVERETRARFDEGVVTAADYADRSTDLLAARLARAQHRVDLESARAHFLTTLGLEVRR